MMGNYISQPSEIKGNKISTPRFRENDEVDIVKNYKAIGNIGLKIPSIHSIAENYGEDNRLQEGIEKSLF